MSDALKAYAVREMSSKCIKASVSTEWDYFTLAISKSSTVESLRLEKTSKITESNH